MTLENNDLINLVNGEILNIKLDDVKVYRCFCKCLVMNIKEIYKKFKNIKNFELNKSIYLGSNMFFNIFWLLLNYTNNIKLSIFLAERAILLYTEFVLMSKDSTIDKDLYFKPTLIDAISFSYKKTIGPLHFNKNSTNSKKIEIIKKQSEILKIILIESINNIEELNLDDLDTINNHFINLVPLALKKQMYSELFDIIVNIFNSSKSFKKKLLFVKVFLEMVINNKIDIVNYESYFTKFSNYIIDKNIEISSLKNLKRIKMYLLK